MNSSAPAEQLQSCPKDKESGAAAFLGGGGIAQRAAEAVADIGSWSRLAVGGFGLCGIPSVLIEALYCSVPIVATDCLSGPREILEDGAHGVFFAAFGHDQHPLL